MRKIALLIITIMFSILLLAILAGCENDTIYNDEDSEYEFDENHDLHDFMGYESVIIGGRFIRTVTTTLDLSDLDIRSDRISQLRHMTNLTELIMWNNRIDDLAFLSELTNLTTLSLSSNQISDLTPLSDLTNLTFLALHSNQINDLTPLSNLSNLNHLILHGNQISDLTPLSNLTNLTILELGDNQINDVTPLANLTSLTDLLLTDNEINDVSILSDLPNLRLLCIDGNPLSDAYNIVPDSTVIDCISADVGDIIEFGDYTWVVLDIQDNHALITTEYLLTIGQGRFAHFDSAFWGNSFMRMHLNDEFIHRFSPTDRLRIRETLVVNEDNQRYGTLAGDDTLDRIFLKSLSEVVQYFGDSGLLNYIPENDYEKASISDRYDSARMARYADGRPSWDEGGFYSHGWWLRSPGSPHGMHTALISFISSCGSIGVFGTGFGQTTVGARPTLWLNLDGIAEETISTHSAEYWENFSWSFEHFYDIRQPMHFDDNMQYGELSVKYIQFINDYLYARTPFSYREKETAVWIVEELLAMGYSWEDIYVQEFPLVSYRRWEDLVRLVSYTGMWGRGNGYLRSELRHSTQLSQNVMLTVPGRSENIIIVGAHYDSWPVHGASDNASGMALLLESARRMLHIDNYYTIMYIFFGAEELGIQGAQYVVDNLTEEQSSNLLLMINADVLFEGSYLFYSVAYSTGEFDVEANNFHLGENTITEQIDAIAYEVDLGLIAYPYVLHSIGSDHIPFLLRGYTVVNLMGLCTIEYSNTSVTITMDGTVFALPYLHTLRDNFDHIEERRPGKIAENMYAFSIFLEAILLMSYSTR